MERRSLILDVAARSLFHPVLLVSLFFTFRGHNAPGGGFAGGLIGSAAFVLRFLAGGAWDLRRSMRPAPLTIVGLGLGVAVASGIAPLLVGGSFLESGITYVDVPVLGTVKLVSSLGFDVGVYLLVVGVVVSILAQLGVGPVPVAAGTTSSELAEEDEEPT